MLVKIASFPPSIPGKNRKSLKPPPRFMSLSSQWIHNSPTSSTSPNPPRLPTPRPTSPRSGISSWPCATIGISGDFPLEKHPRVVRWEKPPLPVSPVSAAGGFLPLDLFWLTTYLGFYGRLSWKVLGCNSLLLNPNCRQKSFLNYTSAFFGGYTYSKNTSCLHH